MTEDRINTARDEHSDSHQPAMSRRIFLAATAAGSTALLPGGLSSLFRAAAAAAGSNFQFVEKTIPQLQAAMAAGQVTARELVLGYLDRIQQLNPTLHAVIETNPNAVSIATGHDRTPVTKRLHMPTSPRNSKNVEISYAVFCFKKKQT